LAYRKGRIVAITATARKIGVFIYTLLTTKKPFCYEYSDEDTQRKKSAKIKNIVRSVKGLNISKNDLEMAWV
jgi:transposase